MLKQLLVSRARHCADHRGSSFREGIAFSCPPEAEAATGAMNVTFCSPLKVVQHLPLPQAQQGLRPKSVKQPLEPKAPRSRREQLSSPFSSQGTVGRVHSCWH